jgi:Regulator of chromosome condensation (RCC1) repeat
VTLRQSSGQVDHWGAYSEAKNPTQRTLTPVPVTLPGPVAEVGTSDSSEYALLTDGTVYAWGWGTEGQLGDGQQVNSFSTPVQVQFPPGVQIASIPTDVMPFNTALAVDTTGHVWGWGLNRNGELCLGNKREYTTPVELPFSSVTAIAGGGAHALYDAGGTVYACGSNREGDLGVARSTGDSDVPVQVRTLGGLHSAVTTLVASFADSGALLANGDYYDWGYDGQGQLGDGKVNKASAVPVHVPLPGPVTQVVQGASLWNNGQTLVMLSDGSLYGWGDDSYYQLGNDSAGVDPSPVQFFPPEGVTYSALATGGDTSYALSTTGDVYAWGEGKFGQIGDGSNKTAMMPVQVDSDAASISATAYDVAVSIADG